MGKKRLEPLSLAALVPKTNQCPRTRLKPIHTLSTMQHLVINATCVATNLYDAKTNLTINSSIVASLVGEFGLEPKPLARQVPKTNA